MEINNGLFQLRAREGEIALELLPSPKLTSWPPGFLRPRPLQLDSPPGLWSLAATPSSPALPSHGGRRSRPWDETRKAQHGPGPAAWGCSAQGGEEGGLGRGLHPPPPHPRLSAGSPNAQGQAPTLLQDTAFPHPDLVPQMP